MEHYLPLVRFHAERAHSRLPEEVELDDLMSAGIFGLIDAVASYKGSEGGLPFSLYAGPLIVGAIALEVRSMDWIPHQVRHHNFGISSAFHELLSELGRVPSHDEIASRLGITIAELYERFRAVGSRYFWRESEATERPARRDPKREAQRQKLKTFITESLSMTQRQIVILYYFEGMSFAEIGSTLDMAPSEARIMHNEILGRVRAAMVDMRDLASIMSPS